MTVTTTVKGYFHITADSLDVAQTFIDIVNELHPEKYEWSTEIGPGITLWSPRPDDKMCYGIPFQAKGRNDYRKNLIDMLQKNKGMALYSALLDILFYDRRDLTVDLLKAWGFSSWRYADYTRTGITNFMTKFKNNKKIVDELSQYDIDPPMTPT